MAAGEVRISIVGGGPRCLGLLDAIGANATSFLESDQHLRIDVFDPYPVGGGRVWRRDQPPLLWMNTPVSTVTIFPDATSSIQGPLRPGPTLHDWIVAHREELLADELLADEVRDLTGDTFASRPLQSGYLAWAFREIVADRAADIEIVVHQDSVVDVRDTDDRREQVVVTESGDEVVTDAVVLAQGHLDDELEDREAEYVRFAVEGGLRYMPPAYTADCDTESIRAGEPVIVNGVGLAFIDWMVLLGQTRGGRFEPRGDGLLEYTPSGNEPVLYVGSRRGAAYHPKITSPLLAPAAQLPRFFTVDAVRARFADVSACDFFEDLWPMACKDIVWAHAVELFGAHPERTAMPWDEFVQRFAPLDYGSSEMASLVERAIPDSADRVDVEDIDRPFAGVGPDVATKERAVVELIEDQLRRIDDPSASVDSAVALAFFSVYGVFGELVRRGMLAPAAIVHGVDRWLHGLFSHVTSGPPPERLAQLAAMHRAGVIRFLGDGTRVWADAPTGRFAATSTSWTEPVFADAMIDARLPPADVQRTVDRLVRALVARGELTDDFGGLHSGRIRVDDEDRLVHADGSSHHGRWAVGPWVVGAGWAHAFPKPGIDAGFFRQNDRIARSILQTLAAIIPVSADGRC